MKRFLTLLMTLCCVMALATTALADAKISVTDKKLITFEGDWTGYFFAKVENTGDTGTYVGWDGALVCFDSDDNILFTDGYISTCPGAIYLEPGETAFIKNSVLEMELEKSTVADYKFSIKADDYGYSYTRMTAEATLSYEGADSYDNYIYVTFTNTTEDVLYGLYAVVALYDQNGALMFVDYEYTSSFGIHPGSTVTAKIDIDKALVNYYTRELLTPTTAEAVVYVEKEN